MKGLFFHSRSCPGERSTPSTVTRRTIKLMRVDYIYTYMHTQCMPIWHIHSLTLSHTIVHHVYKIPTPFGQRRWQEPPIHTSAPGVGLKYVYICSISQLHQKETGRSDFWRTKEGHVWSRDMGVDMDIYVLIYI